MFTMTCADPDCGNVFETNRKHTMFCKDEVCRARRQKKREQARAAQAIDGLKPNGTRTQD